MSLIRRKDIHHTFQHVRLVLAGTAALLLLLYLGSGFYSVKPHQRGVVSCFGRVIDDHVRPGMHYRLPWPFESVIRQQTTEIRSLELVFGSDDSAEQGDTGELLTGDENIIHANVMIHYTIKAPKAYLYQTTDVEALLRYITEKQAVLFFSTINVDAALTTGKHGIQVYLKKHVQEEADRLTLGVHVTAIQAIKVDPPQAVARTFRDVASAREDKQRKIKAAEGQRNRDIPRARATARQMVAVAESHANEAVQHADGDARRFLAAWREYRHARSATAQRLYFDTIEDIMPRLRKIVLNPKAEKQVEPGKIPGRPNNRPLQVLEPGILPPVSPSSAR